MLPLEPGDPQSVGHNRIRTRVGVGGMAIVYFGRSMGGRAVAVKVMHAEFAKDQEYRDRFLREVVATRTAGGRYSPSVLDADPDAPLPWLAMEFLPAVSLREAVRRHGPLPEDAVWPLAAGLTEALASIHDTGVLHLDLKPGNVLLTEEGPRVIDFGIAGDVLTGSSTPGAGSPGYISPEQFAGVAAGRASDVFSYGATLAYTLSGTPRIDSATTDLRALLGRCLDTDPAARPSVPDLVAATQKATSATTSLPAAVLAEIHQRASEANNPPVENPAAPPPAPTMSRRTLLITSGGVALAGWGTTALLLTRDEPLPDTGLSSSSSQPVTTTTAPLTPISGSGNSTLEINATGETTVYTLTTAVNGQAVTETNVALPWRRTMEVPPWPQPSTWRIDCHHSGGRFAWRVTIDGALIAWADQSGNKRVLREGTT